jgi:uncharacterized linocin/CFP29 family protein
MQTLRNIGTADNQLTTEQGLTIRNAAVSAAQRAFVGRKLFGNSILKIDSGAQTFGYDTLAEVSAASLEFGWPGRLNMDILNLTRSTVAIPNLHKETEINKLDLAASRASGTPLNTSNIAKIAYQVAYLEDSMLINGFAANGTTYSVKGLYQTGKASGNYDTTGYVWSTPANIPTVMQANLALLLADNIQPPYNLTINPTQWMQAFAFIGTTAVTYQMWLKEAMQGGDIFVTPAITAGSLMVTAANPEGKFEYVLAEDVTTQTEIESVKDGEGLFAKVYERGLPVVYDANAICATDDLT